VKVTRKIDTSDLPPLQYAVMEILAARYRLGHEVWTLDAKVYNTLRVLADKGLIGYQSGIVYKSYLAWLTDAGKDASLMDNYVPPILGGPR
jgi:hypothetical protein